MTDLPCICIYRPDAGDQGDPCLQIYSTVWPRVGEQLHYWLDQPRHTDDEYRTEGPENVAGTVARVEVEYRHLAGWGGRDKTITYVNIYLSDGSPVEAAP